MSNKFSRVSITHKKILANEGVPTNQHTAHKEEAFCVGKVFFNPLRRLPVMRLTPVFRVEVQLHHNVQPRSQPVGRAPLINSGSRLSGIWSLENNNLYLNYNSKIYIILKTLLKQIKGLFLLP
jgi:hypothetical protein